MCRPHPRDTGGCRAGGAIKWAHCRPRLARRAAEGAECAEIRPAWCGISDSGLRGRHEVVEAAWRGATYDTWADIRRVKAAQSGAVVCRGLAHG